MSLVVDLGRALGQLGDPRFRSVLWRAVLIVLAAFAALLLGLLQLAGWLLPDAATLPWIGEVRFLDDLALWGVAGLALVASVLLMAPATAAAAGFFLDDVAGAVEARHYPALPPVAAAPLARQARDAARFLLLALLVNAAAFAAALALPPLAPFLFWLVNGYLLGREYFGLVAARRLPEDAAGALRRRHAARLWLAGAAMAAPLSVPILNLFVPIVGVAVFTHQFHRLAGDAAFR
ncbi:EI24 domain-containing protein [Amaricoccus sp.]|uniref:EI24 domain-containing protein n=1 Tax=Amaricoccus sp. TaxID=1872485 RepID=UPI0025C09772|nr:EI24 domain-containing protein [Amaricoccus sp.]